MEAGPAGEPAECMVRVWYAPERGGATAAEREALKPCGAGGSGGTRRRANSIVVVSVLSTAATMADGTEVRSADGVTGTTDFTCRSARSGSLAAGLGGAVLVETLVLHLWIGGRHPVIAWTMTMLSVATLAWLAADYVALGHGAVRLSERELALDVGRRFAIRLPRERVAGVVQPDWRDIPESGTRAAAEYLNLTRPAAPNVLITLAEPMRVRIAGGLRRTVRRIGLHVDEPQRLVALLASDSQ